MAQSAEYVVPDLTGRRAIVTGGTKGIGAATVQLLARSGADVLVAVRDTGFAHADRDEINRRLGRNAVVVEHLDLADLASVRIFAERLKGQRIDLLVNNAGVMERSLKRTSDDLEWHWAVNFLGHFLLSELLLPNLQKGEQPRVVTLSSGSHRSGPYDFTDSNFENEPFDADLAYQRSKTACALFAVAFSKRYSGRGIEAFSAAPGLIDTPILDWQSPEQKEGLRRALAPLIRTADQAALTVVYAATADELRGRGGLYIEDCAPAPIVTTDAPGGVRAHAIDPDSAERLWVLAETQLREVGQSSQL